MEIRRAVDNVAFPGWEPRAVTTFIVTYVDDFLKEPEEPPETIGHHTCPQQSVKAVEIASSNSQGRGIDPGSQQEVCFVWFERKWRHY